MSSWIDRVMFCAGRGLGEHGLWGRIAQFLTGEIDVYRDTRCQNSSSVLGSRLRTIPLSRGVHMSHGFQGIHG